MPRMPVEKLEDIDFDSLRSTLSLCYYRKYAYTTWVKSTISKETKADPEIVFQILIDLGYISVCDLYGVSGVYIKGS